MMRRHFRRWFGVSGWVAAGFALATICGTSALGNSGQMNGKTRTYFIAADEIDWDYAPSGRDLMGQGPRAEGWAKNYLESGPHAIGRVYRKAIYREYTDESFTKLKPRPAHEAYLGILGPILRAEVGDTIRVVFRNNATHPYSMHPHGVFYTKDSEGALYKDGTSGADKADDAVPPGGTHTYNWLIPERAGPDRGDPSSVIWLYHSHTDEPRDVSAGLVGAMIITARGKARPDGTPTDVDEEFITLFMAFNENQSWYLDENIRRFTSDPKGVNKGELIPIDPDGANTLLGVGFADRNLKFSINGYLFGNMPMLMMKKGERVRWYLASLGDALNLHSPHWHGNVVEYENHRTDVVTLLAAQMVTVDMAPDNPGQWMFHCHFSDHMEAGMEAMYEVKP